MKHALVFLLAPVLAGCSSASDQESSERGAAVLTLEPMGGSSAELPRAFRVSLRNSTEDAFDFQEPSPLAPEDPDAERSSRLCLRLIDSRGRESQFGPLLTHPAATRVKAGAKINIPSGGTWEKTFDASRFYFWGPCGPAALITEIVKPGEEEIRISAVITSADGTLLESSQLAVKWAVPENLFDPSLASSVEEVDEFMTMAEKMPRPPEREPQPLNLILEWLKDPHLDTRLYAADEIRRRGADLKDAAPVLSKMLMESTDDRDRLLAVYALEAIGRASAETEPALTRALEDKHPRVREKAREALRRIKGTAENQVGEAQYMGKPVSYWIAELARSHPGGTNAREHARKAIRVLGRDAVPQLIESLKSEDENKAFRAQWELEDLYEDGTLDGDIILRVLKDSDPRLRRAAGAIVFEGLEKKSPPEECTRALIETLKDDDAETRANAARALGQQGLAQAVAPLLNALGGTDAQLGAAAADSLGRIGPAAKEAVPVLEHALTKGDAFLRHSAAVALERITGEQPEYEDFFARLESRHASEDRVTPPKTARLESFNDVPKDAGALVFIVDRSGTMSQHLTEAKELVRRIVGSLAHDAEFGIIFSDRGVVQYPPGDRIASVDETSRKESSAFLEEVSGGSASCPGLAFEQAIKYMGNSAARRKLIIYIGDGGGTCAESQESVYLENLADTLARQNQGRFEVYALGVGASPVGELFLRYLSEQNGGQYVRLESPSPPPRKMRFK